MARPDNPFASPQTPTDLLPQAPAYTPPAVVQPTQQPVRRSLFGSIKSAITSAPSRFVQGGQAIVQGLQGKRPDITRAVERKVIEPFVTPIVASAVQALKYPGEAVQLLGARSIQKDLTKIKENERQQADFYLKLADSTPKEDPMHTRYIRAAYEIQQGNGTPTDVGDLLPVANESYKQIAGKALNAFLWAAPFTKVGGVALYNKLSLPVLKTSSVLGKIGISAAAKPYVIAALNRSIQGGLTTGLFGFASEIAKGEDLKKAIGTGLRSIPIGVGIALATLPFTKIVSDTGKIGEMPVDRTKLIDSFSPKAGMNPQPGDVTYVPTKAPNAWIKQVLRNDGNVDVSIVQVDKSIADVLREAIGGKFKSISAPKVGTPFPGTPTAAPDVASVQKTLQENVTRAETNKSIIAQGKPNLPAVAPPSAVVSPNPVLPALPTAQAALGGAIEQSRANVPTQAPGTPGLPSQRATPGLLATPGNVGTLERRFAPGTPEAEAGGASATANVTVPAQPKALTEPVTPAAPEPTVAKPFTTQQILQQVAPVSFYEKKTPNGVQNLSELENADLTTRELAKKLTILEEDKADAALLAEVRQALTVRLQPAQQPIPAGAENGPTIPPQQFFQSTPVTAPAPSLAKEVTGYRAPTGFTQARGTTAADVVQYETQALGNADIGTQVQQALPGVDLAQLPARDIVWITQTAQAATRYGAPVKFRIPAGSKVIATDGDGGYLVLKPPVQSITRTIAKQNVPGVPTPQTQRFITKQMALPPTVTRKVAINQTIRAEERGAKVGYQAGKIETREQLMQAFRESAANVKAIQKAIIAKVKSDLPADAQGKFLQALAKTTSKQQLAKLFGRVETLQEVIMRRTLAAEIKQLKVPKPSMALEYQRFVDDLLQGYDFKKPTSGTMLQLQKLQDFLSRNAEDLHIPQARIDALKRLTQTPLRDLTSTQLTELRDQIAHLVRLGKLKRALTFRYDARAREVAIQRLVASTTNGDPAGLSKLTREITKMQRAKLEAKRLYIDTLHAPRVADMIDGYQGYQGENTKLTHKLMRAETNATIAHRTRMLQALETIRDLGFSDIGEDLGVRLTIHLMRDQKSIAQADKLMAYYEYDSVPVLTEREQQLLVALREIAGSRTTELATTFEEATNEPFATVKNYWPIKYEQEFTVDPTQAIGQTRHRTTTVEQGFTKKRKPGVEELPRVDFLNILDQAVRDQEWYIHVQPELTNLAHIVKSEPYLGTAGQLYTRWWGDHLDIIARRGWSSKATSNYFLREARINLNKAILGYKVSSIVMQPFAIFDGMAGTQSLYGSRAAMNVLAEFSKAWVVPGLAKSTIEGSPVLQNRLAGEPAVEETLEKIANKSDVFSKFIRGGMVALQKADVRTAAGVQAGVQRVLERSGSAHPKEDAEFLMQLWSGSSEVTMRPHILARGDIAKTVFTFQSFFLNRWGIVAHDLINRGVIHGTYKAKLNALVGLGIIIAGSMAEELARKKLRELITGREPTKTDQQAVVKAAVFAIPSTIPFFGDLISAAGGVGGWEPPLIQALSNAIGGARSVITGSKPSTKIRGGMRSVESILSLMLGFPGTAQAFDLFERLVPEDPGKPSIFPKSSPSTGGSNIFPKSSGGSGSTGRGGASRSDNPFAK